MFARDLIIVTYFLSENLVEVGHPLLLQVGEDGGDVGEPVDPRTNLDILYLAFCILSRWILVPTSSSFTVCRPGTSTCGGSIDPSHCCWVFSFYLK